QRQLRDHGFGEEILLPFLELEQAFEVGGQRRIVVAQGRQALRARHRLELEQGVEQRGQALPAVRIHQPRPPAGGGLSPPSARRGGTAAPSASRGGCCARSA